MKLLLGVVTNGSHRHVLEHVLKAIERQTVPSDVVFVTSEYAYAALLRSKNKTVFEDKAQGTLKEKMVSARKLLRSHALENGYDALILIDGNIILPQFAVEALIKTQGDVVAGVYLDAFDLGDKTVVAPVVFKDVGGGNAQLYTYEALAPPQVLEVGAAGFGCCMIVRKVLEQVEIAAFPNGRDDLKFFVDARAKGFKCVANTQVKCLNALYPLDDPRAQKFAWTTRVEEYEFDFKY